MSPLFVWNRGAHGSFGDEEVDKKLTLRGTLCANSGLRGALTHCYTSLDNSQDKQGQMEFYTYLHIDDKYRLAIVVTNKNNEENNFSAKMLILND